MWRFFILRRGLPGRQSGAYFHYDVFKMIDSVSEHSIRRAGCRFGTLLRSLTLKRLYLHLIRLYSLWLFILVGLLLLSRVLGGGSQILYKILWLRWWKLILTTSRLPLMLLPCLRIGCLWPCHSGLLYVGSVVRSKIVAFNRVCKRKARYRERKQANFSHKQRQLLWEDFQSITRVPTQLLVTLRWLATCSLIPRTVYACFHNLTATLRRK